MSEENVALEKNHSNGNGNQSKSASGDSNRGQRSHNGPRPYYQKRGYHQRNGHNNRDGQRPQRQNNNENKSADKAEEKPQRPYNEAKKENSETRSNNQNTATVNQHSASGITNTQNRHNGKYQHGGHKDFNQRRKNSNVRVEETLDDIKLDIERIEKEIGLEIKEIAALQFGV